MMNKWLLLISFFVLSSTCMAFDDMDDNSSQDPANTNSAQNTTSATGSGDLLGEMQKKTEKALKTFKELTGKGESKNSFFADEGSTPTSSQLEGASFGDDDTPDEKEFKLPGSVTGGPF